LEQSPKSIHLAALAIEHGLELCSADTDFAPPAAALAQPADRPQITGVSQLFVCRLRHFDEGRVGTPALPEDAHYSRTPRRFEREF